MPFNPKLWPADPVALSALADLIEAARKDTRRARARIEDTDGLTSRAHASALELMLELESLCVELGTATLINGYRAPGQGLLAMAQAFEPIDAEQITEVAQVTYSDMAAMHERGEIDDRVMNGYVIWWTRNHPDCTAYEDSLPDQGPETEWVAAAVGHVADGNMLVPAPGHDVWLPEARALPDEVPA